MGSASWLQLSWLPEGSLHGDKRGKYLCCDKAGRRWLVLLDIALMSTMGIDIFWPTGVQAPWCFQCPLAPNCFDWSLIHQTEEEADGAPSQPLCFHCLDRAVSAPGCFGLDVGQGPYFPFLTPFCKFMFLVIMKSHDFWTSNKSRKNCFGLIKIIKNVGFPFLSPVLTLKKIIPDRTF